MKTRNGLLWMLVGAGALSSCKEDCKTIYSDGVNRVSSGQTLCFSLKENQTTPYLWKYYISDNALVELLHDKYEVDKHSRGNTGAGGTHSFYFKALAPGECSIEMRHEQGGQKDDFVEKKSFNIIVEE